MTKEKKLKLFEKVFQKEIEYEKLKAEKLPPGYTPRQLANMLDSTGFVEAYNKLIRLGIDNDYEENFKRGMNRKKKRKEKHQ